MRIINKHYDLIDEIKNDGNTEIIRVSSVDKATKTLLIKSNINKRDLNKLKTEYHLLDSLNYKYIIKPLEYIESEGKAYLMFFDNEDILLSELIKKKPLAVQDFLNLAIKITSTVHYLHSKTIIHRDIKPSNFLFSIITGEIRLIDLTFAKQLPKNSPYLSQLKLVEGTLSYLSPEQTGRIDQVIDYRSDLYSLGVTFYEMLTGQLPYQREKDDLHLIYHLMTQKEKLVHELNENIPEVISNIIEKLMNKNPEDRYQSINGLLYDLKKIKQLIETKKTVSNFSLAQHDILPQLSFPKKLYGRTDIFNHISKIVTNPQVLQPILFIKGGAGIGKTQLICELRSILPKGSLLVKGKFQITKKSQMLYGWMEAINDFVAQLVCLSEVRYDEFREAIKNYYLSRQSFSNLLSPFFEKFISALDPDKFKKDEQTAQQLYGDFFNIISILKKYTGNIIIFLDDCQWADAFSLEMLVKWAMFYEINNVMIIGAYRDEKLIDIEPLLLTLKYIENKKALLTFEVKSLNLADVSELIKDIFFLSGEKLTQLAEIILKKTSGNPFYIRKFIQYIYNKNLIYFNLQKNEWVWNSEHLANAMITDNVVNLLIADFNTLPAAILQVLKYAACYGNPINFKLLNKILNKSHKEMTYIIRQLIHHQYIVASELKLDDNLLIEKSYFFSHDRIQEAAYAMLLANEKASMHYKIGSLLAENLKLSRFKADLFNLSLHYNQAIPEFTQKKALWQLAKLNYLASTLQLKSYQGQMALLYLKKTLSLNREYHLNFSNSFLNKIYLQLARAHLLMNHHAEVLIYNRLLLENSQDELIKQKAYETLITSLYAQGKREESLNLTFELWRKFGIDCPRELSNFKLLRAVIGFKLSLKAYPPSGYSDLPLRKGALQTIMRIALKSVSNITAIRDSKYLAYIVLQFLPLLRKFGNTEASPVYYQCLSLILIGMNDLKNAIAFSEVGLQLTKKIPQLSAATDTYNKFIYNTQIKSWEYDKSSLIKYALDQYKNSLSVGDFEVAAMSAFWYLIFLSTYNEDINYVLSTVDKFLIRVKEMGHYNFTLQINMEAQFLENLQQSAEKPWVLKGKYLDETSVETRDKVFASSFINFYYLRKLALANIFNDSKTAFSFASKITMIPLKFNCVFAARASYHLVKAFVNHLQELRKMAWLKVYLKIKFYLRELKRYSDQNPKVAAHYYYAANALWLSYKKDEEAAKASFIRGIEASFYNQDYLFLSDLYENFARHYLARREVEKSILYLCKAEELCIRLKIYAKARDIQYKYGKLLRYYRNEVLPAHQIKKEISLPMFSLAEKDGDFSLDAAIKSNRKDFERVISFKKDRFDLMAANQISLTITKELSEAGVAQALLKNINAMLAANRSVLLLNKKNKLKVYAELQNLGEVEYINCDYEEYENISHYAINSVNRIHKTFLENNTIASTALMNDNYVSSLKVKSLLSLPIVFQKKLQGILYIENNTYQKSFNEIQVSLLKLICKQAAIVLHNVELYEVTNQFIPHSFIQLLNKDSILDLMEGASISKDMTFFIVDIRRFSTIAEKISDEHIFSILNRYLSYVEPVIKKNHGFIDKYIGDGTLAIFPNSSEDALLAAVSLKRALWDFNRQQKKLHDEIRLKVGVAIHFGSAILGTVGTKERLEVTVISDAVNTTSRIEKFNKKFGTSILVTGLVKRGLNHKFIFRCLGRQKIRGKEKKIRLWEVLIPENDLEREKFINLTLLHHRALALYKKGKLKEASYFWRECLTLCPGDPVSTYFYKKISLTI